MEVLKNLKKQMNPKYKKAAAEGNQDNKRLGQLPEERAALAEGENKTERERRKSINYLTNRKKAYGNWERLTDTICCCCSKEEASDDDINEETTNQDQAEENVKIIELLIYSENNPLY